MMIDTSRFQHCRILVLGDLMIDDYVWGEVERISPEAPVQVVSVLRDSTTLGGAGNVVNNLVALRAQVSVAGVIGAGSNGQLMTEIFKKLGVDDEGVLQDASRPTTRKTRIIGGHQHVLRIDRETKQNISKEQLDQLMAFVTKRIRDFDLLLLSDYGKGLLTKDLLHDIIAVARANQKGVIVDPKGLDFSKYKDATVITPNKKEASLAAGIDIVDDETLEAAGWKLLKDTSVEKVLMTCGKDPMVLFEKGQDPFRIHAVARQVFDVSGAGDTVLAVLGLGLASGGTFKDAAVLANTAGRIVVGKVGTATVSQEELECAQEASDQVQATKQQRLEDLLPILQRLRDEGKTIVMANGCFDLLHVGHIKLLAASKKMGDVLVVAIDDDSSVRALKGEGRPIIPARERVRILSALDAVDYVTVFSTKDLDALIQAIRPDILVKGSNYTSDTVMGRGIVEKLGGQVVLVPITDDVSTSQVIDQIKGQH